MGEEKMNRIFQFLYILCLLLVYNNSLVFAAEKEQESEVEKWQRMTRFPGKTFEGPVQPLSPEETILQEEIYQHIREISHNIGPRNFHKYHDGLTKTALYIKEVLEKSGYVVNEKKFQVSYEEIIECLKDNGYKVSGEGKDIILSHGNIEYEFKDTRPHYEFTNLEVEKKGKLDKTLIIGAHYDSINDSPGANDNASSLAASLELAKRFLGKELNCSLRFVFFPNEEKPLSRTPYMGSLVYATGCKDDQTILGMISLEMLGCFSEEPHSQRYKPDLLANFYPDKANFLAFMGRISGEDPSLSSKRLVNVMIKGFCEASLLASEGIIAPADTYGVHDAGADKNPIQAQFKRIGHSDHWSFWKVGIPAIMITDTAELRYEHYHKESDTLDQINFPYLTKTTLGLEKAIVYFANEGYKEFTSRD